MCVKIKIRSQRKPSQVSKPKHSFYKIRGREILGRKLRGYCCSQLDSHHAAFVLGTLSNIQSGSVWSTSVFSLQLQPVGLHLEVYCGLNSLSPSSHTDTHTHIHARQERQLDSGLSQQYLNVSVQRTLVKRTTWAGCVSAFTKLDVSLGSLRCT